MATLNEIVFDIMESLRGNQLSDDTNQSERQIIYHINNQRALWLRNEYNKPGRKIDMQIEQDLGCLKVIEVDAAECCTISTDCYVLRTEEKIPKVIELHSGPAITRVGPVHKTRSPYNFMEYNQGIFAGFGKYTKNQVITFLLNDYIYILTGNPALVNIEYINVRGVFADPTALERFACEEQEGGTCFSYDNEYPINNWMIPYIKEQILQQFGLSLQIPKDTGNDAKEDLKR